MAFALVFAAACSASPAVGPALTPAAMPAARARFVPPSGSIYILNAGNTASSAGGNVTVYDPTSFKPLQTIAKGLFLPGFIALDAAGTLYVGNHGYGYKGFITEYDAGAATPSRTITDGATDPVAMAVAGSGELYVLNCERCLTGKGKYSSVSVYAPGKTTPEYTITAGLTPYANNMAVDSTGRIYVSNCANCLTGGKRYYFYFMGGTVSVYEHGSTKLSYAMSGSGIDGPEGIAFDFHGNVYVSNEGDEASVSVYAPAGKKLLFNNRLGKPSVAFCNAHPYGTLPCIDGNSWPIAFDAENDLYVADGGLGRIRVFKPVSPDPLAQMIFFCWPACAATGGLAFERNGDLIALAGSGPYAPATWGFICIFAPETVFPIKTLEPAGLSNPAAILVKR